MNWQVVSYARELVGLEEALVDVVLLEQWNVGRVISLPPCTAKVNIRLNAINSRLISALAAPAA